MQHRSAFKNHLKMTVSLLALPMGVSVIATPAHAQVNDEIIVTATRRAESIQDIPINIAAIGGAQIEEQGFDDLSELAAYVPGINIVDQGGRDGNRIVVRGLNADPVQSSFGQEDGGGSVATYVGEVPLFVDLRLNDLQRVEVLLGPQGTLYGAGTMGGAIRYIPNKPSFEGQEFELRADAYTYKEGSGISNDIGFTFNAPISDKFAIRGSLDHLDDKGFIDYPFIVQQPGFSNPDPVDFRNAPNDFRPTKDVNTEQTFSGRLAARFEPNDRLDATLTYYFQNSEYGGRNTSSLRTTTIPSDEYEFGARVAEPNERDSELLALEVVADLGFAELTSATGIAGVKENGQRDQTDLLISLEYYYETFPTFTGFTEEDETTKIFNQEVRLVSTAESQFNWIIGGFYNRNQYRALSSEFTPGYVEFLGVPTPQFSGDLEYFEADRTDLEEKAVFGEVGYDISENWSITGGIRYYDYKLKTANSTDFPIVNLFYDVLDFSPYPLDAIDDNLTLAPDQSDDGVLFKLNTSYKFGNGNSAYATFSQGYRVGATNGGSPCTGDYLTDPGQGLCLYAPGQEIRDGGGASAILDERSYQSDTVDNYEIGAKTTWLDGAVRLNGSVFFIDWKNPQVSATTLNAGTAITINAISATTKGFDLDGAWQVSDQFSLRGNFSFVDAKLTNDVPALIQQITPPGFGTVAVTGEDGDRLPGSPKTQFSVFGEYEHPLSNGDNLAFNAGYSWQGEVLTLAGGRGGSFTLPSYGRANISLGYQTDNWSLTGYADNLFNDFSESSAANTPLNNQTILGANVRRFRTNVLPPRSVGARLRYKFQ